MADTSTLDKIISPVTQYVTDKATDFYESIKKGVGYKPDKQQLAEWKSARQFENVYKSPEFNAMTPEKKALFEKHMFDTQIAPSFAKTGRTAPDFKQWVQFRTSGEFDKNITKMYDAFEDRTGMASQYKNVGGRVARSFTNLAENLYINQIMDKKSGKKEDNVTHWFDNMKAAESHFIDKNSSVSSNWAWKFTQGLADNFSDFAVFAALGEIAPELGSVNKVKGVDAVIGGALGKLDIAQELAQTKLGRFALNRLIGAAQGYMYAKTAGTPGHALENTAAFAMFPQGSDPEIKKLLTAQIVMMGPKATVALMQEALPKEFDEAALGKAKDSLTTQLTQANAKIYNDVSKQFGHSMYQFAPKEIKNKVRMTIYANMEEVLKNPLAHADPQLQKYMVEQHLMENLTPEMSAGLKQSAEVTVKTGQKPSLDGLVQEEVAMAKAETAEHNPRVAALEEDRVAPGAASGKSPEFKSNLPKPEMRLEGDVNKYAYALGHYMQKAPNSPYVKMMFERLSEALPNLSKEELNQFPAALRQHMEDLQTTGHTSPNDIRGVFRSTNLNAVFGKGMPTEYQDELADEVEDATGKQKIRKRK